MRNSRRIALFLTLSSSKIKEVSLDCCCQVQKLRKSRRIAVFWCCQVEKLRKSRRIASFSSLQIDRKIGRQLHLQLHYTTQHTLHYPAPTTTTTTTTTTTPTPTATLHYTTLHYSCNRHCNYNYTTLPTRYTAHRRP